MEKGLPQSCAKKHQPETEDVIIQCLLQLKKQQFLHSSSHLSTEGSRTVNQLNAWPNQYLCFYAFTAFLNSNCKGHCQMWYPCSLLLFFHTFAVLYVAAVHEDERENQPTAFAGFVFHESTEAVYEEGENHGFTPSLRIRFCPVKNSKTCKQQAGGWEKQLKNGKLHNFDLQVRRLCFLQAPQLTQVHNGSLS